MYSRVSVMARHLVQPRVIHSLQKAYTQSQLIHTAKANSPLYCSWLQARNLTTSKITSEVKIVTELDEFKTAIDRDEPTIAYFTATWCGPCKMIAPVYNELAEEPGNLTFLKIDVDEAGDIAEEQRISGIPDFKVFKNGELLGGLTGADANGLKALINEHK
eukprot:m.21237 g.21237  ORF g.21237 m.21237 type:complete len:161 (-) comp7083_c0_seq2:51-533(-)